MTRVFARAGRRRWLWAVLVVLGHMGLFLLLNALRPLPAPMAPNIVQVSLVPGQGSAAGAAGPSRSTEDRADATAEREPPATPDETTTVVATEAEPSSPEPIEAEVPPEPSETPGAAQPFDVLAAVQRLVGATPAASPPAAALGPGAGTDGVETGGGESCAAMTSTVFAALQTDEKALGALSRIPADALSVAGALQLWDGQTWADEGPLGGKGATLPIREAAARALSAAPPECLDEPLTGPRFLIVETGKRVVVLVLGSGVWRWRDLMSQTGIAVDLDPGTSPPREN